MKTLLLALTLIMFAAPAQASLASEAGIKPPPTDAACDTDITNKDYKTAIEDCLEAATGWKYIVKGISDDKAMLKQQMIYVEAVTRFEIAYAYFKTESPEQGHDHALIAYNLFNEVHDTYWAKINAAIGRALDDHSPIPSSDVDKAKASLTDDEHQLALQFTDLMKNIHAMYPDVYTEAAPDSTPSNS